MERKRLESSATDVEPETTDLQALIAELEHYLKQEEILRCSEQDNRDAKGIIIWCKTPALFSAGRSVFEVCGKLSKPLKAFSQTK